MARENFRRAGKEEQITLIEGDAADVLKTLEGPYDFIFMDAAKGQYIHFLPEILRLLPAGGCLVSDNVMQDGDVIESRFAVERMSRHPELLVPASSLEVLKTAVIFGADAVYIGGEAFGLRAKAKNFSMEEMKEGIRFAHEHGVKVYVTANILAHNEDLPGVREYFEELKEIRPDAIF